MAKVTNRQQKLFLKSDSLAGCPVSTMDQFIKDNWKYFNKGSGYSGCTTNIKNKFSYSKVNTIHNCVGWYHGRKNYLAGVKKAADFISSGCGNPYEMYYTCKANTNKMKHGGVSQTPELGAAIIWGKPSGSDGTSHSHIAIVEDIDGDYIWISEDNYSTVRTYSGVRSRNGCRKIKKNSNLSDSYPFIGYILPEYKYVRYFKLKCTDNLRIRESASTSATIINRMIKGETCKWYGGKKTVGGVEWYYVTFGETKGWACATYLEAV